MDDEIISVARYKLQYMMPYLADAIFNLTPVVVKDFETMAVDKHWRLYYDPAVITSKWSTDEIVAVLYHEINHLLRYHAKRGEHLPKDMHMVWNVAGDCEINDDIREDRMLNLPGDTIQPENFKLQPNKTAEEYYEELLQNGSVQHVSVVGCGSGATGQDESYEMEAPDGTGNTPGVTDQDAQVIRDKVAEKIHEEASKNRGTVPAGLERWAEVHRKKIVDWRKVLAAYVKKAFASKTGKNDYTYQRLSRRHQGENVIMPSTHEPTPSVSVVIDTSGSMGNKELALGLGEIGKILRQVGVREGVNVLCVDAAVASAKRVWNERQINIKGGGGTDMRVGIKDALARKPKPDILVVITDGYTPWPEQRPKAAVIIALTRTGPETPAWAKTVVISDE